MKVIYILGLEHSGTTLTDQLISGASGVVGVGEVARYFSPQQMSHYHRIWGHFDDAYRCSCGQLFDDCEFWRELQPHSGLHSDQAVAAKYAKLVDVAKKIYGNDVVLVDSSKSLSGLQNWLDNAPQLGLSESDFRIVFAVKDPRSFVASMLRKAEAKRREATTNSVPATSLLSTLRHFNYWVGANREIFAYLSNINTRTQVDVQLSLYEELCTNTSQVLARLTNGFIDPAHLSTDINHNQAHIGIGNKSFIMRNRDQIKYDDAWRSNAVLKCIYAVHIKARKLNNEIYSKLNFSIDATVQK